MVNAKGTRFELKSLVEIFFVASLCDSATGAQPFKLVLPTCKVP